MEQTLLPLGFGLAASVATLVGGGLALRYSNRLSLLLGLAAGVVLGVAFFSLIPEATELAAGIYTSEAVTGFAAVGFAGYMLLDRVLHGGSSEAGTRWRAHLGPASLALHSFLDGAGIGFAFQVAPEIGWTVALAVLTHDLADGINTVSLTLANGDEGFAALWLRINGVAPLLGVLVGLFVPVSPRLMAPLLAMFAGIFLFIGACELIPRSHARAPRLRTTIASVCGIMLMFVVGQWAR